MYKRFTSKFCSCLGFNGEEYPDHLSQNLDRNSVEGNYSSSSGDINRILVSIIHESDEVSDPNASVILNRSNSNSHGKRIHSEAVFRSSSGTRNFTEMDEDELAIAIKDYNKDSRTSLSPASSLSPSSSISKCLTKKLIDPNTKVDSIE